MTSLNVSSSVEIDRPISEVFELVSHPENQQLWWSALHEVRSEGRSGSGAPVRQVLKLLGRRMEFTGSVAGYEENALIEIRGAEHTEFAFRHRFEPIDGKTRVTYEMDIETQGIWKAGAETARKVLQGEVDLSLSHLKHLLEAPEDLRTALDQFPAHQRG